MQKLNIETGCIFFVVLGGIELVHEEELLLVLVKHLLHVCLLNELADVFPLLFLDFTVLFGILDVFGHLLLQPRFICLFEFILLLLPQDDVVTPFVGVSESALQLRLLFG